MKRKDCSFYTETNGCRALVGQNDCERCTFYTTTHDFAKAEQDIEAYAYKAKFKEGVK